MLASIGVSLLKSGAHVAAFGGFRVSFPLGATWLALATGLAAGARAGRRAFPRAPTWAPPVLVVLVGTLLLEAGLWYRGASKEEAAFAGARFDWDNAMLDKARGRAGQESEIPNFKGSYLGHFPLVSADFWTSDHLSERSRSVDVFSVTRARGTLTLKRR